MSNVIKRMNHEQSLCDVHLDATVSGGQLLIGRMFEFLGTQAKVVRDD